MVPHSCENKAISAPSWAWAWAELGKNKLGMSCAKLSSALAKCVTGEFMFGIIIIST